MNTGQLAQAVATATGLDKNQARDAVNAIVYTIQSEVKGGGKVSIAGFGSFEQTKRKARAGRNPKTGEAVKIPTKLVPKFLAGRVFKEVVNKQRKIERPVFLTEGLMKKKLLELCALHGIEVKIGRTTKAPAKKTAAKKKLKSKATKRPAKKKATVRRAKKKVAKRKAPLKAAATRRRK